MIEYKIVNGPRDLHTGDVVDINVLIRELTKRGVSCDCGGIMRVADKGMLVLARDRANEQHGRSPIVGMGSIFVVPALTGSHGIIQDVVRLEAYRGRGIGEQITDKLIAWAIQLGLLWVDLTSGHHRTTAHAMYLKMGFVKRETNALRYQIAPRDAG